MQHHHQRSKAIGQRQEKKIQASVISTVTPSETDDFVKLAWTLYREPACRDRCRMYTETLAHMKGSQRWCWLRPPLVILFPKTENVAEMRFNNQRVCQCTGEYMHSGQNPGTVSCGQSDHLADTVMPDYQEPYGRG